MTAVGGRAVAGRRPAPRRNGRIFFLLLQAVFKLNFHFSSIMQILFLLISYFLTFTKFFFKIYFILNRVIHKLEIRGHIYWENTCT